eukprot:3574106-Ditylum_brightwellii.AAC.1
MESTTRHTNERMEEEICHTSGGGGGENIEAENGEDPRRHYKYHFAGLKYLRLKETVATDTFFPSV